MLNSPFRATLRMGSVTSNIANKEAGHGPANLPIFIKPTETASSVLWRLHVRVRKRKRIHASPNKFFLEVILNHHRHHPPTRSRHVYHCHHLSHPLLDILHNFSIFSIPPPRPTWPSRGILYMHTTKLRRNMQLDATQHRMSHSRQSGGHRVTWS